MHMTYGPFNYSYEYIEMQAGDKNLQIMEIHSWWTTELRVLSLFF